MGGLFTLGAILLFSYLIALGLSEKATRDLNKEKALRLEEKEEYLKKIEIYELEIAQLLIKG